ncbi:pre-mRNA-splicing factor CWC25 [Kwoniella mangroviensis CBS 10435]|uniref:Pre-mRNA-splicing factor CWC25 n=1 Tax=Kwoniella mangroviensis CBS 10435 TaxID=1331196 RepID=A0A1B9IHL1_9TREE|nr:pre-mRNA-splicing factor CWC25 [Kwoniella mangroviensis CBS 10435]
MGGGDLNMKKSWHPVLLVNQERVWKAEKSANEEKKMLAQLRKEREEERQLAELQRLQEATTGKKRVEKMDWMYAAPGNEGGALGGQKIGEREMEEYLLGKKRVDEVLARGDKDVGASHKDFIAVQNANSARDTASKIREDPLLAIRKQEQAALQALMNRPDIRKQLKAAKKEKESKEERKARKKAEKEGKRSKRHDKDKRSPRSDYSDERDRRHRRDSYDRRRDRSRSFSPKRERDDRDYGSRKRYRDESPARRDDRDRRRDDDSRGRYRDDRDNRRDDRDRRRDDIDGHRRDRRDDDRNGHRNDYRDGDRDDPRIPPPRQYPSESRDIKPHPSRPSALDMADRPTTSSRSHPQPPSANGNGNGQSLDDMRAARLAAMQSSATEMYDQRTKTLAQRAEEDRKESERDEKMRAKYGQEQASAGFFKQQSGMNLSETLSRRAGKGLLKDI